ncbi:MAG: VCBS repeat-containing protein [Clostridiales bacterium]|nr:VCBS repeat-containing protein [Clostridiales bacterium]
MKVNYLLKGEMLMSSDKAMLYILDFKTGDVTGDEVIDYIYILGEKPYENSPFRDNIIIRVIDGKTGKIITVRPKINSGYNPTLFLGDFTGDKVSDVLLSIDSGGSGAIGYYYIYSFSNDVPKKIFDFEEFNNRFVYDVNYLDNYKAEVISKENNKRYVIDLTFKGQEYLSEIYNKDGTLKEPIQGWVDPLSGLYPIDFQRDGVYELYGIQAIAGRYHADGLGRVQTSLEWKEDGFKVFFQTVGIFGEG